MAWSLVRVAKAHEVPGRIHEGVHGVGLAAGGLAAFRAGHVQEVRALFSGLPLPSRNAVLGQDDRQGPSRGQAPPAIFRWMILLACPRALAERRRATVFFSPKAVEADEQIGYGGQRMRVNSGMCERSRGSHLTPLRRPRIPAISAARVSNQSISKKWTNMYRSIWAPASRAKLQHARRVVHGEFACSNSLYRNVVSPGKRRSQSSCAGTPIAAPSP